MHAPENDMNNETHAEQKNQLTNQQIKILLSLLGHCSQARASPDAGLHTSSRHVSWWERNDVSKIQTSSIAETVRNCDELRPNYVLHSKSCRDSGVVGSADTFVYGRSVWIQFGRVTVTQCGTN